MGAGPVKSFSQEWRSLVHGDLAGLRPRIADFSQGTGRASRGREIRTPRLGQVLAEVRDQYSSTPTPGEQFAQVVKTNPRG